MFSLPVVPMVLGFDPRIQFVHEDDVVHALEHAAINDAPGVYNVAADGVLALTETVGCSASGPCRSLPAVGDAAARRPAAHALGIRVPGRDAGT